MSGQFGRVADEDLPELPEDFTIQLPVCERCLSVGKRLWGSGMKFYCDGGSEHAHKKTRMVPYVFGNNGRAQPAGH